MPAATKNFRPAADRQPGRRGERLAEKEHLQVIVRRHGVVAAEVAKDTDVGLAWKIEVSTVILPANF